MSVAQIICAVLACLQLVGAGVELGRGNGYKVMANLIFTGIFAYGVFA